MAVNFNPISVREGIVILDGVQIFDAVKFNLVFQPDVWTGSPQLGTREKSRRWLGYTVTGSMTQRRSTNWLMEALRTYIDEGITPEFTLQGISNDANSDFYKIHGSNVVTALGVILTGDIPLISLDTDGDIATDVINFGAYTVV